MGPRGARARRRPTFFERKSPLTHALVTPPGAEPISLAELKAHLRLDGAEEDALLTSLTRTAREHLERTAGLALISQGWRLHLDVWSSSGSIEIGRGPVISIDAIRC